MSFISVPRSSDFYTKMAVVLTVSVDYGNSPVFLFNSSFYAPDNEDEMEAGAQILILICIHYDCTASLSSFNGPCF